MKKYTLNCMDKEGEMLKIYFFVKCLSYFFTLGYRFIDVPTPIDYI